MFFGAHRAAVACQVVNVSLRDECIPRLSSLQKFRLQGLTLDVGLTGGGFQCIIIEAPHHRRTAAFQGQPSSTQPYTLNPNSFHD